MIAVLYDPRAETVQRADPDAKARTNQDAAVILVDDGLLTANGWLYQPTTRRLRWMAYPPGDAADIADTMLDRSPPGFFTAEEFCEIVSAIKGTRQ